MSNPQQTTREVIEQLVEALDHCMDAITERGLNGSPDQAEKWGLQLPLVRAESAITAAQSMLAHPTPSTTGEALVKLIPTAEELGAPQVEPASGPEQALQRLSDLGQQLQPEEFEAPSTFNSCDFEGTETMPAPSTAGERAKVVEDLLMYAGDNGYSHIDYADTMRHAAALLQSTADHIAQNRKLVAALQVGELPEPFHPSASHINPDYRDGWNAALAAARSQP